MDLRSPILPSQSARPTVTDRLVRAWAKIIFRLPGPLRKVAAWTTFLVSYPLVKCGDLLGPLAGIPRAARAFQRALIGLGAAKSMSVSTTIDTCTVGNNHILRASLVLPAGLPGPFPTIIMRTPYGANSGEPIARELAEHGFAVLVQDTRGRFSSEGEFVPVQDEREDGATTVDWVLKQTWCNGRVGVAGISYVGLTAWAALGSAGHKIEAAVIICSQSRVRPLIATSQGAVNLELCAHWVYIVFHLLGRDFGRKLMSGWWRGTLKKAYHHLPLQTMDAVLLGRPLAVWQDGVSVADDLQCPFWDDKDVLNDFSGYSPPIQLIAGWYDFFMEGSLDDFQKAGDRARLIVLPTFHFGLWQQWPLLVNATLWSFQEHLQNEPPPNEVFNSSRVWVSILGGKPNMYLPFSNWPPPSSVACYHLVGSNLARTRGVELWRRTYTYDPLDPTPNIGGPSFSMSNAGPKDQTALEAREDVILFTSPVLTEGVLIAGRVLLELSVDVGSPSADFVGRLCDVSPDGKSVNRCEGLTRVQGPGCCRVTIDLGFTCCLFQPGHAIRLHVCSGAFPRWARNLQIAEQSVSSTNMCAASHAVSEGSVLQLPVLTDPPAAVNLIKVAYDLLRSGHSQSRNSR